MEAPQLQPTPARLRFGVFEADLNNRELFKHGARIPIQEQPFEILCILLERPGEVVSREELRKRLWPDHTFVEYEDSLNAAVRKLRAVLSDRFDQPRYIETVKRRGYRFIAPIVPEVATILRPSIRPILSISPAAPQTGSLAWPIWWVPTVVFGLVAIFVLTRPAPTPRLIRIAPLTHSGAVHSNQKLLTDGPRLYFTERTNGHWVQKWMPSSGGAAVSIALPFHADLQDISPDGSELLIREIRNESGGDAWTVSTAGGAPHRLGIGDILAGAYTRDGHSLLYAKGSNILSCDRDGGNHRPLITLPGEVLGISMSPQADCMRFYVAQGPNQGVVLWEAGSDGSNLHRVIHDWPEPRWEWGGSWSLDGRWFTFNARNSAGKDVWVLGKPGLFGRQPAPVPITSGPMEFVYPIFSRDGKRVFVVGIIRRGELLRYDFKRQKFTQFLGGISGEHVVFSPDQKSVIYVSYPEGQLWRARADGTEPVPLTTAPMTAIGASWSPDGSKIAFEGMPARGARWNVYVIPATGGIAELVASDTDLGGLTWRRDSKSLIIGGNSDENSPLQLVDLQRHSIANLVNLGHAANPSLSPSGRYLVVRTKEAKIAVIDFITNRRKQLATAADDIGYPQWSADERYVYFNRFLGTTPSFYRVRVSDGSMERMMELTQFAATGNLGTWSTIAPDGSLLLLRDLGGADLYAIDWSEG